MYVFDVVLGMDWSTTHLAVIEFRRKRACFIPLNTQSFEFKGTLRGGTISTHFTLQAKKLLGSGCGGYLANIIDSICECDSVNL